MHAIMWLHWDLPLLSVARPVMQVHAKSITLLRALPMNVIQQQHEYWYP